MAVQFLPSLACACSLLPFMCRRAWRKTDEMLQNPFCKRAMYYSSISMFPRQKVLNLTQSQPLSKLEDWEFNWVNIFSLSIPSQSWRCLFGAIWLDGWNRTKQEVMFHAILCFYWQECLRERRWEKYCIQGFQQISLFIPKSVSKDNNKVGHRIAGAKWRIDARREKTLLVWRISVPTYWLIGYVVCTSLPLLYTVPNLKQTPKPAAQQKKEILLTQLCLTIFYFEYLCKTAKSSGSIRLYSPFSLFPSLSPSLILQIFAHKKQQLLNTFSPPSGGSGGCIWEPLSLCGSNMAITIVQFWLFRKVT